MRTSKELLGDPENSAKEQSSESARFAGGLTASLIIASNLTQIGMVLSASGLLILLYGNVVYLII